jgi:hypothetical protein
VNGQKILNMGCGASRPRSKNWGLARRRYETSGIVIDDKTRCLADKVDYKLRRGCPAIRERLELHVIFIQKYIVKLTLSNSESVPRCNQEHVLLPGIVAKSWKCNYCSRTIGQKPYMCSKCNYYLCSDCYCWEGDMRASSIGYIKCPKNHQIRVTSMKVLIEFYNMLKEKLGVECVGCKYIYSKTFKKFNFYHCRRCRFDLCGNCIKKIKYLYLQDKAKCQHGNILEWSEGDFKEYTCSHCEGIYEGVPGFRAETCQCKCCITCAYNSLSNIS